MVFVKSLIWEQNGDHVFIWIFFLESETVSCVYLDVSGYFRGGVKGCREDTDPTSWFTVGVFYREFHVAL